ncbi:MAG: AAA-like domain-containing protein [Cyanobacteria bacterium P01_F01_bin.143]
MAEAFQKVIASSVSIRLDSITSFKLHSMGLVKFQGNEIVPRCQLYCKYWAN